MSTFANLDEAMAAGAARAAELGAKHAIPTLHLPGGDEIWPQVKVAKRLRNGPEDNVWHDAQVLIAKPDPKE